jgi:hypothetical protein
LIRLITYLFLVLFINQAYAQSNRETGRADSSQNGSLVFQRFIPGEYQQVNIDVLDNIYLITAGNQLKKLKPDGDSMAVYNEVKKYGNPSLLDVTNPLKILLYYKNYATVVILDRFLSQRNVINFRKQNIFSVKAIATSYDNQIWIFDEQDYKLKKINEEGAVLLESADLRQLTGEAPSPELIIDAENFVYIYDPEKGFFIFDYYGALKSQLPFLHWTDIAIAKNQILGFSENQLHRYTLKTLNLKNFDLSPLTKDRISLSAMNNKLYLLKKGGLEIYAVQ